MPPEWSGCEGKRSFHTPPGMGVAWDSGHGLLPTKTSRFAFPLVEGSLSRINGGEIGVHAGACAFDGWCGCIWVTLVVYGIVYVAKPASGYSLQAGGLVCSLCAPDELSSDSDFKFLFHIRMHGRYTDSCHSTFSKIVFIKLNITQKGRS
jgi:hypothetical protein